MDLAGWAERAIREVTEGGECVERIRLISTDGNAWETWYRPFKSPNDWTEEAEDVVSQLAEDWPPQEVQLLFVAETKTGTIVSQCTKRTRGKSKGASPNVFGGPGKALADSMDAQARTMDRILSTANSQIELMQSALSSATQNNSTLMNQIIMLKQAELERIVQTAPAVPPELVSQGVQMLPQLLELIFTKHDPTGAAKAAAAAAASAAGATPPTNGAS